MKIGNVLLIGGAAILGYWLWKKYNNKIIDINPPMEQLKEKTTQQPIEQPKPEPQTVIINMGGSRRRNRNFFPESMYSQYNTSKSATISPASVTIF